MVPITKQAGTSRAETLQQKILKQKIISTVHIISIPGEPTILMKKVSFLLAELLNSAVIQKRLPMVLLTTTGLKQM